MSANPSGEFFSIRVQGILDPYWTAWFDALQIFPCPETGETVLVGQLPDQAALNGVLNKLFNLGLVLVRLETLNTPNTPQKYPFDTPKGA